MKEKLELLINQNNTQHKALHEIAVSEFNASDWTSLHKTITRLKAAEILNRALSGLLEMAVQTEAKTTT